MKRLILCALVSLTLAGCSFAPDYSRPVMELPAAWNGPEAEQGLEVQWWKRFEDPVLNKLVNEALAYNQNMVMAMTRVEQARAYLGYARGEQFPTLAGTGSGGKSRISAEGSGTYGLAQGLGALQDALHTLSHGAVPASTPPSREGQAWSATLQAVWELDLWGKYRNATAAAREQLLASEAGMRGALLSLAGQTSIAYFDLRNYDAQLSIARRTLETREEALKIYQARYDEGLISELDFLRAKTETDTMRANVYTAEYQVATAESALMVLTGRSPRDIFEQVPERGLSIDALPSAPQLPAGLPSELLERRPDIVAAEAQLRAANYKIGVAKAAWFPSISLTGQLGTQSGSLDRLFTGASGMWTFGGSVSVPLLTFGRIASNVRISEAAMREALANYTLTVQQAFRDIRNALVIQQRTTDIADTLTIAVDNLRKATELARLRYENGYASYLDVLDAERSLFDAEVQLANVHTSHLSAIVQVCMALGGGWVDTPGTPTAIPVPVPAQGAVQKTAAGQD